MIKKTLLYYLIFSIALDSVSAIFSLAPLVQALDSSNELTPLEDLKLIKRFSPRNYFFGNLTNLTKVFFPEEKLTSIAESSFK